MNIYRTYSHHSSNKCFTIYWTCFFRSSYFIHFLYNVPPLQETVGLRWRFARAQRSESRETWRSPAMDCWWQGWVLLWMATPFPFREMNIKWPYIYIHIYLVAIYSWNISMAIFMATLCMYIYMYMYIHKVVYIIYNTYKTNKTWNCGCVWKWYLYMFFIYFFIYFYNPSLWPGECQHDDYFGGWASTNPTQNLGFWLD